MWKQASARLNIVVAPCVEYQYVGAKGCHGLVCKAADTVRDGEVLALVPYLACISPITALASPWGQQLAAALRTYTVEENGVRVSYSKEAALTTVFTALAMQPRSPLEGYLRQMRLDEGDGTSLAVALGPELTAHMTKIDALNSLVVAQMHEDLSRWHIRVPMADLVRAHRACASRCVDVPDSEEVFGGPSLVPVVDLINHGITEPNVTVYMESTNRLGPLLRRHSRLNIMDNLVKAGAFCVVMRATRDVMGGTEFTYPYIDPTEDPTLYASKLYWASRFRFVPPDAA
ncbi:SET domain containing protein [Leishmania donovani]|uniref:SET_domain_containing_protein_-_putative n=3 Tax=Leishmania donovani species complex TaxID=38574 RepID=A0A6L0XNW1_LEIIN|nr:conserved hypothetical protein [Leishmania infantum JPCM5]TPP54147.1 SET domain family protein [Leishmania donovani]CAC9487396.1 SET_domain_containing_protein_-_putative [Leishmania infantum]CAJ1988701.1 SET domain containing protein [Leishmania donovani]CBZ08648.1 conserved hypothetical protein [Leishmania infantum JPCM5]SUZ41694.1 SET_domain_containing_protein_-_putative [Leishmania infantum]|eukprot:XP_003392485.1 conserved hypothetical protein [Leishmania infantum JPCM5]